MKIQITRHDLESALAGPAVLVLGPSGPEWVTDYTLYQDRGEILAHRGNGTFDEVFATPHELMEYLRGEGPWIVGVATSARDVVRLWSRDVDAIAFRGMILKPE